MSTRTHDDHVGVEMGEITRRRFIGYGAGVGAALALPWTLGTPVASASPGGKLTKYVQAVPLPGQGIVVATPSGKNAYSFDQVQIARQLHPQLPPTPLWAYDDGSGLGGQAGSLGMAVVAHSGTPLQVSYTHMLPATYPGWIPVDTRLTPLGNQVRVMTHLHGGFVAADSDGNPAVTPNGFGPGDTQIVHYSNQRPQMPASLLWFHDHGLGTTRLNVFAGLAAAYIIRDEFDTGTEPNPIGIPGGAYEIPLVVQDRQINADGTLLYPTSDIDGVTWIGEYFGDVMLVNGKVWPFLNVEPRMYRFRILNGCNARILNLNLGGAPLWQIGAEGGMWDIPVRVKQIVLAPAERADLLIDFGKMAGRTFTVGNSNPPKPVATPAPSLSQVMQIRVGTTVSQPGPTTIPPTLLGGVRANLPGPDKTRYITLNEIGAETAGWFLNLNGVRFGQAPVTENPQVGHRRGLGVRQPDRRHPPDALSPGHLPGRGAHAVQRSGLPSCQRRTERCARRDRPNAVRHRAEAARRTDRTRLQGHGQGQSRLFHNDPRQVRPATWGVCTTAIRLSLPHRRARGQRHDASVHRGRMTR